MQRLAAAVSDKVDQMRNADTQIVKNALKSGEKVLFLGQHGKGLSILLRVTKPKNWNNRHNISGLPDYLDCVIPPEKVAETIAWVKRNYPTAEIRMAD